MQTATEMADYFKSDLAKEKRAAVLHLRVSKNLKDALKQVAEFWTAKSKAQTGVDVEPVPVTDVVVRLLRIGVEAVWADAGLKGQPTKAEIEELIRSTKSQG